MSNYMLGIAIWLHIKRHLDSYIKYMIAATKYFSVLRLSLVDLLSQIILYFMNSTF